MLSAEDLLVSTFFSTAGNSILRYNDTTHNAVPGSVATGDSGALFAPEGLAVAPDGTFYVSTATSQFSAVVLHYSSSGTLMGQLGQSDTVQAPLQDPTGLAIGPNGHLYVADQVKAATINSTSARRPLNSISKTTRCNSLTCAAGLHIRRR